MRVDADTLVAAVKVGGHEVLIYREVRHLCAIVPTGLALVALLLEPVLHAIVRLAVATRTAGLGVGTHEVLVLGLLINHAQRTPYCVLALAAHSHVPPILRVIHLVGVSFLAVIAVHIVVTTPDHA